MQVKAKMNTKVMKANAKKSENIQSALSCFYREELCHSSTHTESGQKIHQRRTLNTPASSFGVRKAVTREILYYL